MDHSLFEWIGNEALLHELIAGLPTFVLLGIIVVCILLLSKGADWMIDGVVDLAERTGMPRIVIGATIISLGTTMPEAFVSVMAAWMGNPGLALGNGVGSIIADTGLIFGLTCILAAVPVNRFILNRTGWVQVGTASLLVLIAVLQLITTTGEPVIGRRARARQPTPGCLDLLGHDRRRPLFGNPRRTHPCAERLRDRCAHGRSRGCDRRHHGGFRHLAARVDDRHCRSSQRAPRDHRGQCGGGRCAQLPFCHRCGGHGQTPGHSAQLLLFSLPGHADHPVVLPGIYLNE